jgi:hypothetical protein
MLWVVDEKFIEVWMNGLNSLTHQLKHKRFIGQRGLSKKKDFFITIGGTRIKSSLAYSELFEIWIFFAGIRPRITPKSFAFLEKNSKEKKL